MSSISAKPEEGAKGVIGSLFSYSVTEEATPLNPADSSGSVGQASLSAKETGKAEFMAANAFTLTDPARGAFVGLVESVATAGGRNTFSAESALGYLNTDRLAAPHIGTVASAFTYYLRLAGITSDQIEIDPIYERIAVAYPGWTGNVWDYVKKLCAATRSECQFVAGTIVLRQPGIRKMPLATLTDIGRVVSVASAAQQVEIINYNSRAGVNELCYEAESALNVDVGEVLVQRFLTEASLSSVNQPKLVDAITQVPYAGGTGEYMVSGNDGLPIDPDFWTEYGGSLKVSLTENPFEIEVTLKGPSKDYMDKAPFRIAEGEAAYPALYVTGSGVFTKQETITLYTGASAKTTSTLVGATIDNPFIQSLNEAYRVGLVAACAFAGPAKTITFDQKAYAKGGQEFGNVAGSMINHGYSRYRVRSATLQPGGISGTADSRVTVGDVNRVHRGKTFAEMNATYRGMTFGEQAIQPLKAT